jgi:putative membrane protein
MTSASTIIKTAEFNPKIKTYVLLSIAIIMVLTLVGIPFILFWFLGLGQYLSRRYYENLKCELTDKHLEFKKGILFKVEKTIPLENIQDLTFIENPLLKALDLRTLKIETAGQSNPQGSDMKLIGILNSREFKETVLKQRELLKTECKPTYPQSDSSNNEVVDVLTEIRDMLIEIKNK